MNKSKTASFLFIIAIVFIISCKSNPAAHIQGVYEINKDSLENNLSIKMEEENIIAPGVLKTIVENSVVEFSIKNDSILGIIFLGGQTILVESIIIERNDNLLVSTHKHQAHIIPTESGLKYQNIGSDLTLHLNKTDRPEMSFKAINFIKDEKRY